MHYCFPDFCGIKFKGRQAMKKLQRVRTRRQLLRATAVSAVRATAVVAASIPFLALARKSASAKDNDGGHYHHHGCFLKGTKISTPSGDRLMQDLRIGDEVQTLAGRKTIKWIAYNKFTKEEGRAWHDNVMPIRVALRSMIVHLTVISISRRYIAFFSVKR